MILFSFLKKYLLHTLAIVFNFLLYFFLLAPILVSEVSSGTDVIKTSLNYFQLMSTGRPDMWFWIVFLILYAVTTHLVIAISITKHFAKVKEVLVTIQLMVLSVITCLFFISKEFFNVFAAELVEGYVGSSIGWGFVVICLIVGIQIVFTVGFADFSKGGLKVMVENAMLVAAAFVLSFIKLFSMPTGGSINFQMLPLMIIAIRRGPLSGFLFGGFLYGLLTCFVDGYGFQSFPFDYLIGFGSVAILGFFKPLILGKDPKTTKKKDEEGNPIVIEYKKPNLFQAECFILLGGLLATCMRFVGGCTSSIALYGYNFPAAAAYNFPYIFISGGISIAVLMLIFPVLRKIKR